MISQMPVHWGECTRDMIESAASRNALVVVPLGCTEQHAHHLPVDTDTYQVERATVEAARKARDEHGLDILVLPPLPFGPAPEHAGMGGTISLTNELYVQLIKQIVWSVIDCGFRHIVVVTGCGGHWAVPGALWDLKAETRRASFDIVLRIISVADGWSEIQQEFFPGTDGGHAAVMGTALCLAGRDHLVDHSRMIAPEVDRFRERYIDGGEVFLFGEITSTGALGDPTPATVEGGELAWMMITDRLADRFRRFVGQDQKAVSS